MNRTPAPPTALASQGTYPSGGDTFVAPLPEDAYFETNPGRMRLSHDGNHQTGSFQKVLAFLLADQMTRGPLTVYVSSVTEGDAMQRVSGRLTHADENEMIFQDGFTIPLHAVLDIEF